MLQITKNKKKQEAVNRSLFLQQKKDKSYTNNGTNDATNLWTMRSTQDHTGKDDDDYKARRFKKKRRAPRNNKRQMCPLFQKIQDHNHRKNKKPNSATRIKYTCTHIYGVGIYIYILF